MYVAGRWLFSRCEESMKARCNDPTFPSALRDLDPLMTKMFDRTDYGGSGDLSGCDKSQSPFIMSLLFDVLQEYTPGNSEEFPRYSDVWNWYVSNAIYSVTKMPSGKLYLVKGTLPSGVDVTAMFNTIYNSFMFIYNFVCECFESGNNRVLNALHAEPLSFFRTSIWFKSAGDDLIFAYQRRITDPTFVRLTCSTYKKYTPFLNMVWDAPDTDCLTPVRLTTFLSLTPCPVAEIRKINYRSTYALIHCKPERPLVKMMYIKRSAPPSALLSKIQNFAAYMYYHRTWWNTCQLLLRTLEVQIEHYSAEIWSEGQYASIRGEPLFEDSKKLCSGVKLQGVDAPQLKMMHANRPNVVGEIVLDSKPKRKRSRKRGSKKVSEPATISVARVANRGEITAAPVALTAPKRRRKKKSTYNTFEPMHSASALGLPHAVAQAAEGALCPDTATQFFPAPAFTASKHLATFKQTSFINKLENYAANANQLRAFVIMDPRPDSGMLLTKQTSLNEVFLPRTGDVASLDNRLHFELNNAQKSWGLARDKKKAAAGALLSFIPRACRLS